MRKSKYIGLNCGDWVCTHVGIATVQGVYKKYERDALGRKVKSKSPGSKQYYYIFERLTHDGKAMKMIRLSAAQAKLVLAGKKTVEEFSLQKEKERSQTFTRRVSYSFCD